MHKFISEFVDTNVLSQNVFICARESKWMSQKALQSYKASKRDLRGSKRDPIVLNLITSQIFKVTGLSSMPACIQSTFYFLVCK
jgi:hypothetical protein